MSKQKRGLAFYKESGKPWTLKQLNKIKKYCGEPLSEYGLNPKNIDHKYIYDDGDYSTHCTMYPWRTQDKDLIAKCTKISYESVFKKPEYYAAINVLNQNDSFIVKGDKVVWADINSPWEKGIVCKDFVRRDDTKHWKPLTKKEYKAHVEAKKYWPIETAKPTDVVIYWDDPDKGIDRDISITLLGSNKEWLEGWDNVELYTGQTPEELGLRP
jgi:hypothetical protein